MKEACLKLKEALILRFYPKELLDEYSDEERDRNFPAKKKDEDLILPLVLNFDARIDNIVRPIKDGTNAYA